MFFQKCWRETACYWLFEDGHCQLCVIPEWLQLRSNCKPKVYGPLTLILFHPRNVNPSKNNATSATAAKIGTGSQNSLWVRVPFLSRLLFFRSAIRKVMNLQAVAPDWPRESRDRFFLVWRTCRYWNGMQICYSWPTWGEEYSSLMNMSITSLLIIFIKRGTLTWVTYFLFWLSSTFEA
jgi:hypothetical protein